MKLLLIAIITACFAAANIQAEETAKAYPLQTCVVTGEKLGSMGKPYRFLHEGKEVQFCCKSCMPKFKKDPAKYMKKIEEAGAKSS